MSEDTEHQKTPHEQLEAVISRLKEIEHYSRSNIEHLGADWFHLDDGLKLKDLAKGLEPLMTLQNQFQDAIVELIEAAEAVELEG